MILNKPFDIVSLLVLVIAYSGCSLTQSTDDDEQQGKVELVEEYQLNGFNKGLLIRLYSDGSFENETFSSACTGGGVQKIVSGYFTESGNRLEFNPMSVIINDESEDGELTTDTLKYHYSDSTKIQTVYYKIRIGQEAMLISNEELDQYNETYIRPSNFIELANGFNSGEEISLRSDFLALKDSAMRIENIEMFKDIPTDWQDYFLPVPIECSIISVEINKIVFKPGYFHEKTTYTLDKGESSGLKLGMRLYSQTQEYEYIEVYEVNKESSKARELLQYSKRYSCNKGTVLSTRRKTN